MISKPIGSDITAKGLPVRFAPGGQNSKVGNAALILVRRAAKAPLFIDGASAANY